MHVCVSTRHKILKPFNLMLDFYFSETIRLYEPSMYVILVLIPNVNYIGGQ